MPLADGSLLALCWHCHGTALPRSLAPAWTLLGLLSVVAVAACRAREDFPPTTARKGRRCVPRNGVERVPLPPVTAVATSSRLALITPQAGSGAPVPCLPQHPEPPAVCRPSSTKLQVEPVLIPTPQQLLLRALENNRAAPLRLAVTPSPSCRVLRKACVSQTLRPLFAVRQYFNFRME
jgi:hypothetical protein